MYETPIASLTEGKTELRVSSFEDYDDLIPVQVVYNAGFWEKLRRIFTGYTHVSCWVEVSEEEINKFTTDLEAKFSSGDDAKGLYFYTEHDGPKTHMLPCPCCDYGHNILFVKEPHEDEVNDNALGNPEYVLSIEGNRYVPIGDRISYLVKNEPVSIYEVLLKVKQVEKLVLVLNERPTKPSAD